MTVYTQPGQPGSVTSYLPRCDNWMGGKRVPPDKGEYFDNPTPVTCQTFREVARGTAADIQVQVALDPAHRAASAWGRMSITARGNILNPPVSYSPKALGFF
jgi:aldehyde dehydrogenase